MITANEIFSIIRTDSFFENVFHKEVDWDAELDARDKAEFDMAWNSSYEELNEIDSSESKVIRDIREFAFKQTFRITQNSELAGLWDSYLQGKFPK
ncbi:hypothetical protein LQV63_31270 [Paenibacillus profundus]|uniref:Uncharacterized protein n=1 Tax=Paenibacillus profundus TaxID=1173085 RepID=A0ABS8YTE9_9BACL|nr:hypothetical protein [Paenibacillus profundus]MCE5173708.1 hypothetical protein [Paenibacillus profundus]